ncbi:hypothetical protein FF2_031995 [Malus domestica]
MPLQVTHAYSRPCLSHKVPSTQPSLGASDQNALTDDEEGWTLVTYKKTRNPIPQDTKPKVEQTRKHHRRNNRKPKKKVRVAKPTYVGEPMQLKLHIPVSLYKYIPKDFFQQCTIAACLMVEVKIEEPSKGKAITVEEKKTHTPEESQASVGNVP